MGVALCSVIPNMNGVGLHGLSLAIANMAVNGHPRTGNPYVYVARTGSGNHMRRPLANIHDVALYMRRELSCTCHCRNP
jgi:hypothetical protein